MRVCTCVRIGGAIMIKWICERPIKVNTLAHFALYYLIGKSPLLNFSVSESRSIADPHFLTAQNALGCIINFRQYNCMGRVLAPVSGYMD